MTFKKSKNSKAEQSSASLSTILGKKPQNIRVVVAMSGGVDSSVAAALMHDAGYEVIGITLQLYDHGEAIQKKGACCAGQDIHDARNVAAHLGIAHYVLNYQDRFKQKVIDDFADSYIRARRHCPVSDAIKRSSSKICWQRLYG